MAEITEALRILTALPPQDAVILTDSASAIQRVDMPSITEFSTVTQGHWPISQQKKETTGHTLQWISGYVGIICNVRADRLTAVAHRSSQVAVDCAPYACGPQPELVSVLREHFEATLNKRTPVLFQGLRREEVTALTSLRTGSAFTKKWLLIS